MARNETSNRSDTDISVRMVLMRIAILGYSRQGQSAYEYWDKPGNELVVCDQNDQLAIPSGMQAHLGADYLKGLDGFDLLIRTPALHPRDIVAANPASQYILDKVTTVTNEFFRVCPSKHIIGVTGTKGKGTTSTLIAHILEAAGKRAVLGGNIGIAPTELLKLGIKAEDWVVLELANFQLIDLQYSPPIAVCLLVEPEHLDWHTDMAEYMEAKSQLFVHQKASDQAIYYAQNENSLHVAGHSPGVLTPYMAAPGAYVRDDLIVIGDTEICATSELKLLGKHNWQNICAAITAIWPITQDIAAIRETITQFIGLPHRLEPVRVFKNVTYYNDSFASAPPATKAALDALPEMKVMIVGGFDRGLDITDLVQAFVTHQEDIRQLLLIGQVRQKLADRLKEVGFTKFEVCDSPSMEQIVARAQAVAKASDTIVLSPGFASFDMFKDFEDRGQQYKATVEAL